MKTVLSSIMPTKSTLIYMIRHIYLKISGIIKKILGLFRDGKNVSGKQIVNFCIFFVKRTVNIGIGVELM